jgi:hypothetical protein
MSATKKTIMNDIPKLTRSFLTSTMDHACNDARAPYHAAKARFEEWKLAHSDKHTKSQEAQEKYIINYSNPRMEYEHAYTEWIQSRDGIIKRMKNTNIIGEQEKLMAEFLNIPFPDILDKPIAHIYTRYKANENA